jgi:DNA-binding FadR family transcriptional regulator
LPVEDIVEVTSLREPKMAARVATVLRRMFIRGEIPEGTMLPPESELMERFRVYRPTLREAFRVLESESLIEVQRGVRGGAQVM